MCSCSIRHTAHPEAPAKRFARQQSPVNVWPSNSMNDSMACALSASNKKMAQTISFLRCSARVRALNSAAVTKADLSIVQGMVKELTPTEAHLSTGEVLPYGICVWSTGVGPTSFTTSLPFAKTARGRIAIDGEMRVLQHVDPEKTGGSDPSKPSDVSKLLQIADMVSMCKCLA